MSDIGTEQLIALGFMIGSACLLVHVGSKRSLPFAFGGKGEMLSKGDAAQFPITGSLTLFSLYVFLKLVPRYVINWLLSTYLTLISIKSLTSTVKPYFGANIVVGLCAVAVGVHYFRTKDWISNNTLAYAIAIMGIEAIQLKTYAVSAILLCGLFLYDIFWVFGTDVMVTVARGIDGPIKLVFPQTILSDSWEAKTMLGLGDIIIPGFFISQMYRFSVSVGRGAFYYNLSMVAYTASLVNTMFVMVYWKHAQPALLYIVPWLLISTFVVALIRGDIGKLLGFDQEAVLDDKHKNRLIKEGYINKNELEEVEEDFDASISQIIWLEILDTFGLEKSYKQKLIDATKKAESISENNSSSADKKKEIKADGKQQQKKNNKKESAKTVGKEDNRKID